MNQQLFKILSRRKDFKLPLAIILDIKMVESMDYPQEDFSSTRVRDLEEKQKLLKDRVLLVGENLVELREEFSQNAVSIRRDLESVKDDLERVKDAIRRLSEDLDSKARREDLAILQRQAKMFDPLNLATVDDVKRLIGGSK